MPGVLSSYQRPVFVFSAGTSTTPLTFHPSLLLVLFPEICDHCFCRRAAMRMSDFVEILIANYNICLWFC
jgi:hypothetical protein